MESSGAKNAVERYEEQFPTFADTRECDLIKTLLDAAENERLDDYTDAVKKYDSIQRIDQWLTTILLAIKKRLQEGDDVDLT